MSFKVITGDCVESLKAMADASIDAVVCDPPYGIGFMGHEWDQPGEHGPVRSNGSPADFAGGRAQEGPHGAGPAAALERQMARSSRRATQRTPSTGAGHARERQRASQVNPAYQDARSGVGGGAMHAGRYDLTPTANRRFQAWCETWATECLRVLKPGGHLVAFGSTRTDHRLKAGIEDAGFEIRDTLAWMFGSGFPKSLNVSKAIDAAAGAEGEVVAQRVEHDITRPEGGGHERLMTSAGNRETRLVDVRAPATPEAEQWEGWGTALKPGYEPIVLARKPLEGTVAGNVLRHGTGALNIDGCRVGFVGQADELETKSKNRHAEFESGPRANAIFGEDARDRPDYDASGRWPANVVMDEEAGALLDEQGEARGVHGAGAAREDPGPGSYDGSTGIGFGAIGAAGRGFRIGDDGGPSRFFYCAKASTLERNVGLDGLPVSDVRATTTETATIHRGRSGGEQVDDRDYEAPARANVHPTVKPIALMRWLVRMVTPPGGTVLDVFTGSGTTGCAAVLEGFDFVGLERDELYVRIATARIEFWSKQHPDVPLEKIMGREVARVALAVAGQDGLF